MALSAKLELRQSPQLVMTPQLQQAIRLLQMSNIELAQFVEAEIERNPLLERDEGEEGGNSPAGADGLSGGEPAEAAQPGDELPPLNGDAGWLDLSRPAGEGADGLDAGFDNLFPDAAGADGGGEPGVSGWAEMSPHTRNFADGEANLEAFVPAGLSLKDHLLHQLGLAFETPAERMTGQFLIGMIDEAGYLPADLSAVAGRLGAPPALVEHVLATMQTFDPPGVFARSLAECLALQLKDRNRYDPLIARVLDNLPLLAARDLAALRRATGADAEDLADMIAEIKRLDPKPGLRFANEPVTPVIPDIFVRGAPGGGWIVELNSETLPRVLINRAYYAKVSQASRSEGERTYLQGCLQTAAWLTRSLDQRARTILRVAEEIVRQQDAFLTHGVEHLRPLNLRTVAEAIPVHESTVSRVTSNKYMATPRGIFELKYFFTSAIASAGEGEAHSSEAVRHRIRQLIAAETAAAVLSDDRIVEILKNGGIDIARRTVAKYREAMRIPSSVQRRREKRLNGHCNGA